MTTPPRIGVLGGSFDPIHHGHLILAQIARETLALDRVHLVVAGRQPLKPAGHTASAADRLRMVELATAGVPGLLADGREIARGGPSWTVETLRDLAREVPGGEFVLVLGADAARGFAEWREPEAIRALARIAVCRRGGEAPPAGFDLLVDVPALELSSTAIRARAAEGRSLAGWVPGPVADYISGLRLYRSDAG